MNFNPQTHVKAVNLLVPTALSATTTLNNSAPNLDVDCLGYTEALILVSVSDAITLVTDLLAVQFKETATAGSAYSDVTGALLNVTGTSDNTVLLGRLKLEGRKRFLSATLTETGTFAGTVAITVILFNPQHSSLPAQTYAFSVV